jgi:hypothetical protein
MAACVEARASEADSFAWVLMGLEASGLGRGGYLCLRVAVGGYSHGGTYHHR